MHNCLQCIFAFVVIALLATVIHLQLRKNEKVIVKAKTFLEDVKISCKINWIRFKNALDK